jgi:phosphoribosylformylglycinamidine synthase
MKAKVLVRPKEGILDPQGEAVANALRHLGFEVADARVGRLVELDVKSASLADANEAVAKMCDHLLANPLIETCEFEVTE